MAKQEPLVSIIILNYNFGDLLLKCVESIKNSNYTNYEIILVDNASRDNSHKLCKEKFPEINLIENEKNLGYGGGNNVGIAAAKGDFLVLLNPDTVVQRDWLQELLLANKMNGNGLYQPKLLMLADKSKINSAGNMIQTFGFGYSLGKTENDCDKYNIPKKIGFASGACLFFSKDLMDKVGFFDPFLFAYHDDMDLGWRAAKVGISSYYVPSSVVYHLGSYSHQSKKQKFYLLERNRHYCILTHYSTKTFLKMLPALILIEMAMFLFFASKGMLKQKFKASSDIIKNRKYISKKHAESEKLRKVTDQEILKNFVDKIFVPEYVVSGLNNKIFNAVVSFLSKSLKCIV